MYSNIKKFNPRLHHNFTYYNHHWLFIANFFIRSLVYLFTFGFFFIVAIIALTIDPKSNPPFTGNGDIDGIIIICIIIAPLLLLEWRIRANRRKLDLPIYKDISEELLQLEVIKKAELKNNASVNFKNNITIKKDINYYFELKEKGAITQEEYEEKKKELLNLK
ncbi:hypothetical protein GCM10012288_24340 [Malaciobacter pacificus]|uniref:Uncharacterized protein n=1 Tax=Malaciobacter pacificus TaxID=1080223 RepID=A0A5C2H8P6_9BACT|nr:SHOCT domain-containing protein [Malaciobacter pacificus]QEP35183.1 hypothetical protein APAC_2111 [Malaciobacter pacificus]GGD49385.1 hypothetical protein GCM10012288_24340 [Malaciobacter pacificus]